MRRPTLCHTRPRPAATALLRRGVRIPRRLRLAAGVSALGLALAAGLSAPAQAVPPADPDSIITGTVENDATSTQKGTSDQYYTSGLQLGYVSPTGILPAPLEQTANTVFGDGVTRISLGLSQAIFTPKQTQLDPPDPHDHPYAGELLLTGGLIHDTDAHRDFVALSLGVIGPSALGQEVQNGFHSIIGDTVNRGWHYQVQDEPGFNLLYQRTWRFDGPQFGVPYAGAIETDALPSLAVAGGDVRTYGQAGLILRVGQGLHSDYGASRIEPGLNGTDAYTATRPFAWYAFAGVDGQAVGYDAALQGDLFRQYSPHVSKKWDVGEMEAGLAFLVYGFRVAYTQTWQTEQFHGQKAGLFNFGSLTVSGKF